MFKEKDTCQYILTSLDGNNRNLIVFSCYRQIQIEGTEQNYEISHVSLLDEIENG